MSDSPKCPAACPKCGSTHNTFSSRRGVWCCGTRTTDDGLEQSELCKLRQRDALLAECVGVMERYCYHRGRETEGGGYVMCGMGMVPCECGLTETLAALKQRIEAALKGEE